MNTETLSLTFATHAWIRSGGGHEEAGVRKGAVHTGRVGALPNDPAVASECLPETTSRSLEKGLSLVNGSTVPLH